jgi:hypothetical protein
MTRETVYLVQGFKAGKGARLTADPEAGVVAFSTSGDAELGEYDDEPTITFKAGKLPAPFGEA